jgi:adenylosuccinate lyase
VSSELFAISPLDGRYKKELKDIANYFSEFALIKERVYIESQYLIFFSKAVGKSLDQKTIDKLKSAYDNFNPNDAIRVKRLENKIDHDVKAVEVYLGEFVETSAPDIHFGLTSEDVNNLAYSRILIRFIKEVYLPTLKTLIFRLLAIAKKYQCSPMLGRTHGQPASPTTFGKEMGLYAYRVSRLYKRLSQIRIRGKLNGAVGNFNALIAAYPNVDWITETSNFIEELGLEPELFTAQILPYEHYAEVFGIVLGINSILIGLCRDIWMYYSYGLVRLNVSSTQIGSSTMPHKVNPKEFENSEGNLKLSNTLLSLYLNDLLINRLQRDLSDSTIRRSFGSAFAHAILAYRRLIKGLTNIEFDEAKALKEINNHGEVFSEPLQILLRKAGIPDAYFMVLDRVKGRNYTIKEIEKIASSLIHSPNINTSFQKIIKSKYLGLACKLTEMMIKHIEQNVT